MLECVPRRQFQRRARVMKSVTAKRDRTLDSQRAESDFRRLDGSTASYAAFPTTRLVPFYRRSAFTTAGPPRRARTHTPAAYLCMNTDLPSSRPCIRGRANDFPCATPPKSDDSRAVPPRATVTVPADRLKLKDRPANRPTKTWNGARRRGASKVSATREH